VDLARVADGDGAAVDAVDEDSVELVGARRALGGELLGFLLASGGVLGAPFLVFSSPFPLRLEQPLRLLARLGSEPPLSFAFGSFRLASTPLPLVSPPATRQPHPRRVSVDPERDQEQRS